MSRWTLDAFSFFPYFTKANADTPNRKRLQHLLYAVKNGGEVTVGDRGDFAATEWFAGVAAGRLRRVPSGFLGSGTVLVPMPSSAVTALPPSRASWPMFDLAERLAVAGVVGSCSVALMRHTAVAKAHQVSGDQKPTIRQHAASFTVSLAGLPEGVAITLLDDVLSSGTNAMGAERALREAGFEGEVRLLTVTHTVGSDYQGEDEASATSLVLWFDDRWDRAWRPPDDIRLVK